MSSHEPQSEPQREYSLFAAFLSYLVPGMGQIYSGRIAKGLLFLVCLYGMFFYGMALSDWSNVYLPRLGPISVFGKEVDEPFAAIAHRPQFAGQFWIGIAAWPAIWQYYHHDSNLFQVVTKKGEVFTGVEVEKNEEWLVLRDGATEHKIRREDIPEGGRTQVAPLLGSYQRTPSLDRLNDLQRNGSKAWDLAWVYTVIAGVLNVLVIYDAFAGPAFLVGEEHEESEKAEATTA
ncbi:MAG: DUF6677 family protein [Gemmataceae bacterium]